MRFETDLLLVHPPGFYDFRERSDIYWPFMSSGGSELITPLYENFPVGFKTLQRYLREREHVVDIVNLSTVLLMYPTLALERLLAAVDAKIFGIDLHWMVHVQGSLELAKLLKRVHPGVPIVFGGISSTYYAHELMGYPQVDMVMRGYDTHAPMDTLLRALQTGADLRCVPNLLWKSASAVVANPFSHTPRQLTCGMDLSTLPQDNRGFAPIKDVLTTENAGCAHNCGWCGGSRDAFRRVNQVRHTIAQKSIQAIEFELSTVSTVADVPYNYYSLGTYSEPPTRMRKILEAASKASLRSVMFDLFFLASENELELMVATGQRVVINLSPQSHDVRVSKLSGRGTYTMAEMEVWIEGALKKGIAQVDIYFFVGMPEQDERSVMDSVEYCRQLLTRFKGERVVPILCPMAPFLDPASNYFEDPDSWGYRIFFRSVEEHRRGMERASLVNRMNYETKWLSREKLISVSYEAIDALLEAKNEAGMFPSAVTRPICSKLRDAVRFMEVVHRADSLPNEDMRAGALRELGGEILRRNREMFGINVVNQAFPIPRRIGGRWYDEVPWSAEFIQQFTAADTATCTSSAERTADAAASSSMLSAR